MRHCNGLWPPSAASLSGGPPCPPKPPNSSHSWYPTVPGPSTAPSTSSTAAPSPPPDRPAAQGGRKAMSNARELIDRYFDLAQRPNPGASSAQPADAPGLHDDCHSN